MNSAFHKRRVGENLKLVREALGMSQGAMAKRFDLGDDSKVSNWERGLNYPDPYFVWRLWQEEGITADWIYLRQPQRLPSALAESLRVAAKALEAAAPAEASPPEPEKPAKRRKTAAA